MNLFMVGAASRAGLPGRTRMIRADHSRMIVRVLVAIAMTLGVAAIPRSASAQEIQVSGGSSGEMNVYIAEEGDTLWDIADRFFSDTDYWPTLWSFNPQITNPNWIFPGDLVFLVPPQPRAPDKQEGYKVTESRWNKKYANLQRKNINMVIGSGICEVQIQEKWKASGWG